MIDQKTAFEYAQALEEFVLAGGTIEQICACEERKEVVRKSYHIMPNPAQVVTVEQIDSALVSLDAQKEKLDEVKITILEEEKKIVVEEEKSLQ